MPIRNFLGETFVAFTDISGFKEMMKGDGKQAVHALDRLNQVGYNILLNNHNINGLFVSDSGVIFVNDNALSKYDRLKNLLNVLRSINRELLQDDIMLTTSIAFGHFSYHQRLEFEGIEKNPIFGNAYVTAYFDNEKGKPKIQPGQCRIVNNNVDDLYFNHSDLIERTGSHFYYYWMVNQADEITDFKNKYTDAYQLKYQGMLKALKRNG
ncbi:MAG: hypothetical protein M0Q01_14590 [Syntrophales bacterium]|jgi:hypothetical protein|nr:hypothetical protein [Syntrophales bacterium]